MSITTSENRLYIIFVFVAVLTFVVRFGEDLFRYIKRRRPAKSNHKSGSDYRVVPLESVQRYIHECIELAKMATCRRSRCGSVIVSPNGVIVGQGFNSMPLCVDEACFKDSIPKDFKSDRTCCIHAEQRAIMNAGKFNTVGCRLYFVRIDENDKPVSCGEPYCTMCSKMALDAGIVSFVLYHDDGMRAYEANHYNKLSFQYQGK